MAINHESSTPVTIAVVQMACVDGKSVNIEKALTQISAAADRGANIVCLQELFAGTYPCQSEDHDRFAEAEPIPGPTSEALSAAARHHGIVVVGSLFEHRAAGLYHNTAVVFDADGSQVGLYRKMHIPDDPLFYEKFYFTPGDLGFRSFPTRFGRIGVCVCWDQWFPEAARLGNDDAQSCHRERRVRCGPEPRGSRRPITVLGRIVRIGSRRERVVAVFTRRRGDTDRRMPSRSGERHANTLAVSARSANRRLWRPHPAVPRR